ncbi:MAG: hypothetical protein GY804_10040 [Alphaproteobacteria bacterium]|nr:hypothetical protein [Alphaproteobacteria bacterium]
MRKEIKELNYAEIEEVYLTLTPEKYYCLESKVRKLESDYTELEKKLKIAEEALTDIIANDNTGMRKYKIRKALKQIKGES